MIESVNTEGKIPDANPTCQVVQSQGAMHLRHVLFQCHRLAASHVNRSDVMTLYGPVLRLAWLTLDLRQQDLQGARLPHSPLKAIL